MAHPGHLTTSGLVPTRPQPGSLAGVTPVQLCVPVYLSNPVSYFLPLSASRPCQCAANAPDPLFLKLGPTWLWGLNLADLDPAVQPVARLWGLVPELGGSVSDQCLSHLHHSPQAGSSECREVQAPGLRDKCSCSAPAPPHPACFL